MKRFLVCFLAAVLLSVGVLPTGGVFAAVDAAPINPDEAEYLLDEWFQSSFITSTKPFSVSGWEVQGAAGDVTLNPFMLMDTSDRLGITMRKEFRRQEKGRVTLESRFKLVSPIEETRWQLLDSREQTVLSIAYKNGKLVWEGENDVVLLEDVPVKKFLVLKAELDLMNGSLRFFIDENQIGGTFALKTPAENLNYFVFSTGEAGTGAIELTCVMLYKGYLVHDRILAADVGRIPAGWQCDPASGEISAVNVPSVYGDERLGLRLNEKSPILRASARKNFQACDEDMTLRYVIRHDDSGGGAGAVLFSGEKEAAKLVTKNQKLCWIGPDGKVTEIREYRSDFWYDVRIVVQAETSSAQVYINHRLAGEDLPVSLPLDGIAFWSSPAGTKGIVIDDVYVYRNFPLPEDYVPAPEHLPDDGVLTGIQSCSLWHEGRGHGWNKIAAAEGRKPLLGYYDEGKTEVSDWETKWMVEHGIDFQMFCWFRWMENAPMKGPYVGSYQAMHQGFMESQYKDDIQFSFMFENVASGVLSSEDFRNNVVPYWIEYYFKNPSFLVVDNKPVVGFYSKEQLVKQAKGYENAKEDLAFLKEACVEAGFDGCYVLVSDTGTTKESVQECIDLGFDGAYAYNWNTDSSYIEKQKQALQKQADIDRSMLIPTVVSGWDATPWGKAAGTTVPPEDFQKQVEWIRNDFMKTLAPGSLGTRMMFVANWNEYGEGTFISPNETYGFKHLDALKNGLYGEDETHTDELPTAEQIERVTRMYPDDVYVPPLTFSTQLPPGDTVEKGWYFEEEGNTEGWTTDKHVENLRVEGGMLCGDVTGRDPDMILRGKSLAELNRISYVRIRMVNNTPGNTGVIYFTTNENPSADEGKALYFPVEPNCSEVREYTVYALNNIYWKDQLEMLRIDPVGDALGDVKLESVEFLQNPLANIRVNGLYAKYKLPLHFVDDVTMIEYQDLFSMLGVRCEQIDRGTGVVAVDGENVLKLTLDSAEAALGEEKVTLNTAPVRRENEIYLPLRGVCEALGYEVLWDEETGCIDVLTKQEEAVPEGTVKSWEFNLNGNPQGWKSSYAPAMYTAPPARGLLGCYVFSTDPVLMSPGLDIPCSDIRKIKIRFKNGTAAYAGKVYFITKESGGWGEDKQVAFDVVSNDESFTEYEIDMSASRAWEGTLKQLRIDFVDKGVTSGKCEIDYIRLCQ